MLRGPYSDPVLPTTKHERILDLPTLSYKRPCPDGHNEYWVVDAEPNGIMPPLPRRAMGPDRNCRQLNCPVPIAHRGRGSAEVDLKATFSYNIHGRKTYHNEKRKSFNSSMLVRLSYKKLPREDLILISVCQQRTMKEY